MYYIIGSVVIVSASFYVGRLYERLMIEAEMMQKSHQGW